MPIDPSVLLIPISHERKLTMIFINFGYHVILYANDIVLCLLSCDIDVTWMTIYAPSMVQHGVTNELLKARELIL